MDKTIVSLTYDDALPVHYQKVAPFLEKYNMRATFYLSIVHLLKEKSSIHKWKEIARKGHELGNHSLFHPCRMKPEFHEWLDDWRDLKNYTPDQFKQELEIANLFLSLIDGNDIRSYGNTCCDTILGDGIDKVYISSILDGLFIGARGGETKTVAQLDEKLNVFEVGHFSGDGKTAQMLQEEVLEAQRVNGGWITYMFHGVGKGSHTLFIDEKEHNKFISWLSQEKNIEILPFRDVLESFSCGCASSDRVHP